ncbi:MAG: branched-chain amino acid ABC transporter permease [Comamonadaceae bacterium]|nr:MAG: branched-chain amino acid ABC transporter permease [Comamonadaceae bacterium]
MTLPQEPPAPREQAPQSLQHSTPLDLRALAQDPYARLGVKDMIGTCVGIGAWGLVTGVAMVKSGMDVPLAIFMSLMVYAGSAQLAVLPLMMVGAPLWVIWLTASCVNLRFVIFSSMWRSYFHHLPRKHRLAIAYFSGDVIFVAFMKRFPKPEPRPEQVPYFWGAACANWFAWQVPSIAGILLANAVPLSWGLGFAGVLALLGVLLSMLQDRATWLATVVASTAAIAAFALPLKLNILVAIASAVTAGLLIEAADRHLRKPAFRMTTRSAAGTPMPRADEDKDETAAPAEERRP